MPELHQRAMTSFILPWLHSTSCKTFNQDVIGAEQAGLDDPRVASLLYMCVCVFSQMGLHSHQTVPTRFYIHFSLGLHIPYFHTLLGLL